MFLKEVSTIRYWPDVYNCVESYPFAWNSNLVYCIDRYIVYLVLEHFVMLRRDTVKCDIFLFVVTHHLMKYRKCRIYQTFGKTHNIVSEFGVDNWPIWVWNVVLTPLTLHCIDRYTSIEACLPSGHHVVLGKLLQPMSVYGNLPVNKLDWY